MPSSPRFPLPRLAIVGRPNVGKSSLMNLLAERKVSIVDDTPGTTRDRVSSIIQLDGPDPAQPARPIELTDTGGYGVYTVEGRRIDDAGFDLAALTKDIEQQIAFAVESADLILLVIDAQAGVTPQDEEVARLLREGGLAERAPMGQKAKKGVKAKKTDAEAKAAPKIIVVANKVDGPRWEMHALEASALGFGEPIMVSAKNNYRRREFVENLFEAVGDFEAARKKAARKDKKAAAEALLAAEAQQSADPGAVMHLAIVGKRNAGKSTLVNHLVGFERVIVSEIPGTTRDAVDVRVQMEDGRALVAIDTAGLRKKKSFQDRIEWFALDRLKLAVSRCDVALFLIDATEPVSQVDQQVGQMLTDSFKPVVIVVNKWDLAKDRVAAIGGRRKAGEKVSPGMYEEYLRAELKGLWYAPIAFMSGKTGQNVRETIDLSFEMMEQSRQRVSTGKLNRLFRTIIEKQGPTNKLGTFAKVFYCAQIGVSPPTIVCVVNRPELFTPNYQRFLLNRFREELPFSEVPIKLVIRARKQDEEFADARDADDGSEPTARAAKPRPRGAKSRGLKSGAEYFKD